jgi:hypothetical protein
MGNTCCSEPRKKDDKEIKRNIKNILQIKQEQDHENIEKELLDNIFEMKKVKTEKPKTH